MHKTTEPEQIRISSIPCFKQACDFLRADILATDKEVTLLKTHPTLENLAQSDKGEVIANLMLAHRHLEDARMRLGKAIQHSETRESIFDIQKDPEQLGKLAYQRYCEGVLKINPQADFRPWDVTTLDERACWAAAASAWQPVAQ